MGLLIFLFFFFSLHQINAQSLPLNAQAIQSSKLGGGDFTLQFQQALKESKEVLGVIKSFSSSLGAFLQQAHYLESSKIEAIQRDPRRQNKAFGLVIDFTYAGAGSLAEGYQGVIIKPVIEIVPPLVKPLFSAALELSCKTIFDGRLVKDQVTHAQVLRSSPFVEFFLKLILLVKSKSQKKIDKKNFNVQFLFLVYRLFQTPGFKNADDLFKRFPAPLKSVLTTVKIQKKSLRNYLKGYFETFQEIKNYNFLKQETTSLKKRDLAKVMKIVTAIFLRAATDAQQVSDSQKVVDEMQERLFALFQRLSFYRQIKNTLRLKLSPLVDPLLSMFGLTLDAVLPPDDQFSMQPGQEMAEQEFDAMLTNDPLFGTISTEEQVVAIPDVVLSEPEVVIPESDVVIEAEVPEALPVAQEAASVSPEPSIEEIENVVLPEKIAKALSVIPALEKTHPIDFIDDVMDAYDKLDQQGFVEQATEQVLEKHLMNAVRDAHREFLEYENQDLVDLAYVLLDAQTYVEQIQNRNLLRDFFLEIKREANRRGIIL